MRGVRGKRKNKRGVKKDIRLLGVNTAGIRPKVQSFRKVLSDLQPHIFFLEETKSKKSGSIKLNNYVIFEHIRQNQDRGGGRVALGVKQEFHPVFVSTKQEGG